MNNIFKIKNQNGSLISYADDTALIFSGYKWTQVKTVAEFELQKLRKWLEFNKLTLNIKKTKCLTLSPTSSNHPDNLQLVLHSTTCNFHNCKCAIIENVKKLNI